MEQSAIAICTFKKSNTSQNSASSSTSQHRFSKYIVGKPFCVPLEKEQLGACCTEIGTGRNYAKQLHRQKSMQISFHINPQTPQCTYQQHHLDLSTLMSLFRCLHQSNMQCKSSVTQSIIIPELGAFNQLKQYMEREKLTLCWTTFLNEPAENR